MQYFNMLAVKDTFGSNIRRGKLKQASPALA